MSVIANKGTSVTLGTPLGSTIPSLSYLTVEPPPHPAKAAVVAPPIHASLNGKHTSMLSSTPPSPHPRLNPLSMDAAAPPKCTLQPVEPPISRKITFNPLYHGADARAQLPIFTPPEKSSLSLKLNKSFPALLTPGQAPGPLTIAPQLHQLSHVHIPHAHVPTAAFNLAQMQAPSMGFSNPFRGSYANSELSSDLDGTGSDSNLLSDTSSTTSSPQSRKSLHLMPPLPNPPHAHGLPFVSPSASPHTVGTSQSPGSFAARPVPPLPPLPASLAQHAQAYGVPLAPAAPSGPTLGASRDMQGLLQDHSRAMNTMQQPAHGTPRSMSQGSMPTPTHGVTYGSTTQGVPHLTQSTTALPGEHLMDPMCGRVHVAGTSAPFLPHMRTLLPPQMGQSIASGGVPGQSTHAALSGTPQITLRQDVTPMASGMMQPMQQLVPGMHAPMTQIPSLGFQHAQTAPSVAPVHTHGARSDGLSRSHGVPLRATAPTGSQPYRADSPGLPSPVSAQQSPPSPSDSASPDSATHEPIAISSSSVSYAKPVLPAPRNGKRPVRDPAKLKHRVWLRQNRDFQKRLSLQGFKIIDTGDGFKKCSLCNKKYSKEMFVWRHSLTHVAEKPFHCDVCDQRFTRSDTLQRHIRRSNHAIAYTAMTSPSEPSSPV